MNSQTEALGFFVENATMLRIVHIMLYVIGAGVLLFGIFLLLKTFKIENRYTLITAKVENVEKHKVYRRNESPNVIYSDVTISYRVDNKVRRTAFRARLFSVKVGESFVVGYNPENPSEVYPVQLNKSLSVKLIFCGLLLLFVSWLIHVYVLSFPWETETVLRSIYMMCYVIGACLLIGGALWLNHTVDIEKKYKPIVAKIENIVKYTKERPDKEREVSYDVTVSYQIDNKTFLTEIGRYSSDMEIGGDLDMMYNPANPNDVAIPKIDRTMSIWMAIGGLFILLMNWLVMSKIFAVVLSNVRQGA